MKRLLSIAPALLLATAVLPTPASAQHGMGGRGGGGGGGHADAPYGVQYRRIWVCE